MIEKLSQIWQVLQDAFQVKGGTFVDLFAVVMIARLLAPLKGAPAINASEAAVWSATIAAFAYSNNTPKQS